MVFFSCCIGESRPLKDSRVCSQKGGCIDKLDRPPSREVLSVIEATQKILPDGKMSTWQEAWCTDENVGIFIRARKGDIEKVAEILAAALQWREQYKDILMGRRLPNWVTDLRVLTRGQGGHPIVYTCALSSQRGASPESLIEHMAAVFEAAVLEMRHGATQFIFVLDLHGFQISDNLDLRPTLAMMHMAKHPYRERLGLGVIVDAPWGFGSIWRMASSLIPERTAKKIHFVSGDEVASHIGPMAGETAANVVASVIARNRKGKLVVPTRLPSEISDKDCASDSGDFSPMNVMRTFSRSISTVGNNLVDSDGSWIGFILRIVFLVCLVYLAAKFIGIRLGEPIPFPWIQA